MKPHASPDAYLAPVAQRASSRCTLDVRQGLMADSSQIEVRKLTFDVERGAGGLWIPRLLELWHTLNAFQLALPYLEAYFIDAIREGVELVSDPQLKADALAFCAQEANHSRQHKRYCRLLQ